MQWQLKHDDIAQSGQHLINNTDIIPSLLSQQDYCQGVSINNLSASMSITSAI